MRLTTRALTLVVGALCASCAQEAAPPRPLVMHPSHARPDARPHSFTTAYRTSPAAVADAGVEPDPAASIADAGSAAPVIVTDQPFQTPLPANRSARKSVASRFASLTPGQCRAELRKRKIGSRPPGFATPNVATPMRLKGALRGVQFIAPGPRSVFGILDCRLALVLDELASLLAEHDVSAVHVDSMYRPRARMGGSRKPSQHSHGLAVDIIAFTFSDGRTLTIKDDWHGALSTKVCGPGTQPVDPTPEALTLWNLVCAIAKKGLFHHMLTPNFNKEHEDHLHFDIKRDGETLGVH
jgi:hypothetical protein